MTTILDMKQQTEDQRGSDWRRALQMSFDVLLSRVLINDLATLSQ
jgi:hypothetical protein